MIHANVCRKEKCSGDRGVRAKIFSVQITFEWQIEHLCDNCKGQSTNISKIIYTIEEVVLPHVRFECGSLVARIYKNFNWKRSKEWRRDRVNLPWSIPILWRISFSMLRMGMEMTFAQNYGWEIGFTCHPLPCKDSCHGMIVFFLYDCGGNAVLQHVWNSEQSVGRHVQRLYVN